MIVSSWGRLRKIHHEVRRPAFVDEARAELSASRSPVLAYGKGRSYGDVCLNEQGCLIMTDMLDRFLSIDYQRGTLRAEAGTTFDQLLRLVVPHGWFVPVTPGTKFVSLGGAVANDVHGKNHEMAGTFGSWVLGLGLARSSGEVLSLSRDKHPELFAATIGGLGLTGVILWVELQLVPIRSAFVDTETLPMANLDEFFRLAEDCGEWPYTVAWVDCLATGRATGRGFFIRGRHAQIGGLGVHRAPRMSVPLEAPNSLLNAFTISSFNWVYRHRPWALGRDKPHYGPFFYPLDSIHHWNRLYGSRGFFQHQCVIPMHNAADTVCKLLELTAARREGSFLVVLKLFGDRPSPGVLSFPMHGATLALDFPNKGESTRKLLARMSDIVLAADGRLYPAKDATMSADAFRSGYPNWRRVEAQRDPVIMSDFWRRVTANAE